MNINESYKISISHLIDTLKKILQLPKPGLDAQLSMCTRPRPGMRAVHEVSDSCQKAGVLLLLYPIDDTLHLVLTHRTDTVGNHRRQIALPGGRQESGESLEQTAIRETHEELGISTEPLQGLGTLTPLYIPPSDFCIYPTVAFCPYKPDFHPSPHEVAEIIEIPLDHLLDPENRIEEIWTVRGVQTTVPFFAFGKHKIWGATAMILSEFVMIVKNIR